MQLDEFIKETLVQIAKGVKDAQEDVDSLGGRVNPSSILHKGCVGEEVFPAIDQPITFDIALQVKGSEKTSGNAGAKLSVFSLGVKGENSDESSTTHRIKFTIPMSLPATKHL